MRYLTILAIFIAAIAVISGSPKDANSEAVENDRPLVEGERGADISATDVEADEISKRDTRSYRTHSRA